MVSKHMKKILFQVILIPIIMIYIITNFLVSVLPHHYMYELLINIIVVMILNYSILSLFKIFNSMINKHKKLIQITEVYLITLINLIFIATYQPFFNSRLFYVKHITLFILISFMVIYLSINLRNYFTLKIINNIKKLKIIKAFILSMTCITLILISQGQLFYINHYVVPPLFGCSYYDTNHRLIYNSQFVGSCPTLDHVQVKEHDDNTELTFSVYEEKVDNYLRKHTVQTNIYYKYDLDLNIINYTIISKSSLFNYNHETNQYLESITHFYKKDITNYFQDNSLTSNHHIKKEYSTNGQQPVVLIDNQITYTSSFNQNTDHTYMFKITKKVNESDDEIYLGELYYHQDFGLKSTFQHNQDTFGLSYMPNNRSIIKTYVTDTFNKQRTLNMMSFSMDSYFITYLHQNYKVDNRTDSISLISQSNLPRIESVKENQPFGYILKHYNYSRDTNGKFISYQQPDFVVNTLSYDIESLENYELFVLQENTYPIEFVYQRNPLLFENQIIKK